MKKKIFSVYGAIVVGFVVIITSMVYYAVTIDVNFSELKAQAINNYEWMNAQNEFVMAGLSIWFLGVVTYLAKGVPSKLWQFLVKQATVTLTLNNCDNIYYEFLIWYKHTGRSKKSRTLVADDRWCPSKQKWVAHLSSGYGMHFFWFDGKLFKFVRAEKEASQTRDTKESITLVTIGRSQAQFKDLVNIIKPVIDTKSITDISKWDVKDRRWLRQTGQAIRTFDSVILPKETKDLITNHLDTFLEERDWYINNGIPYRTGVLLHGIPGSGKTSLVRGLCERLNKQLHIIGLNTLTDETLEDAFNKLPANSIVLMEDIDTYGVTNKRDLAEGGSPVRNDGMMVSEMMGLTLSGLLNAIDGIAASDGRIIIATTNNLEQLDSALIRKGRFNLTVDIGYLTDACFRQFFHNFYPTFKLHDNIIFSDKMSPAELQSLIIDNREDPENVLDQCVPARKLISVPALNFQER